MQRTILRRPFCLSVRTSVKRAHCDKTKVTCANILISQERSFILIIWQEEWIVGRPLLPEILGQTDPVGAKTPDRKAFAIPSSRTESDDDGKEDECLFYFENTYELSLWRYWRNDLTEQWEKRNGLLKLEVLSVVGLIAMMNWLLLLHSLPVPSCWAPTLYNQSINQSINQYINK